MADNQNDDQQADNPNDLRVKLETANKLNQDLTTRLQSLEQDTQLRDAGLGHLSQRQRRVILRELQEEGTDFSVDSAKEIAKELGYSETPPPPANDQTSDQGNGQGTGQSNDLGQGQQQEPEEPLTALEVLAQQDKARRVSSSNRGQPDLTTQINQAQSKDELRGLIRDKGGRAGIVLDADLP